MLESYEIHLINFSRGRKLYIVYAILTTTEFPKIFILQS